jgi:hypothetical protein
MRFSLPGSTSRRPSREFFRLQQRDHDDEQRLRHGRDSGRHAKVIHRGRERLNQQRAEKRAEDREPPAGERGAADHDGEDRIELGVFAGAVRIGGADVGGGEHTREACAGAAEHIRERLHARGGEPGEAAGRLVVTHGFDEEPGGCAAERKMGGDVERADEQRRKRQTENKAVGEKLECWVGDDDDLPVDDELGHAATGHHQDERRHDGLNAEARDEQTVGRTGERAGRDGGGQRDREPVAVAQEQSADRTRNGDDGADREIDAARGDDEGHTEREQHRARTLRENVNRHPVKMAVLPGDGEEGGILREIDQHEHGEPTEQPEER